MIKSLLVASVACVLLTSCVTQISSTLSQTSRCDEIIHPSLLSIPFEELGQGREVAENWIVTHFPTTTVEYYEQGEYKWSGSERYFSLWLNAPIRFVSQSSEQAPTIEDVLHCYGDPDYYLLQEAFGPEAGGIVLSIYYTDLGFIFGTAAFGEDVPSSFTEASVLDAPIFVTPPGTLEEVFRSLAGKPEENIAIWLVAFKPWPKSFTELVIDETIPRLP